VNGEVHGGRPRPNGAVVPRKKKKIYQTTELPVTKNVCVCVCVLFQTLSVSRLYGSVGITTDYRLDGLGLIPDSESDFSLFLSFKIGPGTNLTSNSTGTEESFVEAKRPRREASY
jgi:hypothetical protein